ncbi:MAG: nucleoside hydrolase [Clostridiales bacterium]|jgi:inosine-uridine nucleoside N-ribohydrolase|nr:nucleoside hydrolase [Clostridiales bacterium]
MRILLDTDIGGDVDDALALALVLHSPELELAGITLVYEDNQWRAGLLRDMLSTYGREIPFVLGAEQPLTGRWGAGSLGPEAAADFIIQGCEQDPDLVIVGIGPLTNIAAAFKAKPSIAAGRRVCLMAGDLPPNQAEWNIKCDPKAAAIVYGSGANLSVIGLNVTERCYLTQEDVDLFGKLESAEARLLSEMLGRFMDRFNILPILHDPLAIGSLIWDDVLVFEKRRLKVETGGFTVEAPDGAEISAAVSVKAELFKERLLRRIRL